MSEDRALPSSVKLGLLALLLLVLAGGALIYGYLERERERDLQQWEVRLALVADSRVAAIRRQLEADLAGLTELANNASLQLYLSQLALEATDREAEPAQLSYLRNLILSAAQREDLLDEGPGIQANVAHVAHQGLALVDREGRLVTTTPHMPALQEAHRRALAAALESAEPALIDLHLDEGNVVSLGYVVPVPALQALAHQGPGGALVAVWRADRDLFPLLHSGALLTPGDVTLLVRREGDQVRYLSPLDDGSPPLQHSLPLGTPDMAGTLALARTGQFVRATDHRGRLVLMISRPVPGTPWVLIQQADLDTALADAREHRRFLLTSFSLLLFFIAAALVAAWRHGSSVRARQTAAEPLHKTQRLDTRTQLLHGITDHIDAYTILLDDHHELVYANTPLAHATGIPVTEMLGRTLASVVGTDAARRLLAHLDETAGHRTHSLTLDLDIGGHEGRYHCTFVPLQPRQHGPATRLLVLHDVTELERAQQRHAELMRKLVGTLMHVVDLHDPHSGHHSARVAEVADAVAAAMGLTDEDRRVLDLAAGLANLGKIFVPREILTKETPLTEAEQDIVRRHVQYSLDLLKDLDFDGPVLDTIAQKQEFMDGSGYPHGLHGDQLLLTARILAVANAFVALLSSRAWRGGSPVQAALDELLREAGQRYDRHVVAALFHVAENRKGEWSQWEA